MTSEVDTIMGAQEIKMGTEKLREIGIPKHSIEPDENGQVKLSNQGAFEKTEVSQQTTAPAQEATASVQETLETTVVTPTVEATQTPALETPPVATETVSTDLQNTAAPVTEEVKTETTELNTATDQTAVSLDAAPATDVAAQTETTNNDLEVSAVEAATEIMKATQDSGETVESIEYDRGDTLTEPAVSVSDPNGLASLDFGPKNNEEPAVEKKEEEATPQEQTTQVELPPMTESILAQEPTGDINTALFATNTAPTTDATPVEGTTVTTDVTTPEKTQEVATTTEGQQVEAGMTEVNTTIPASDMVVADNPFIAPPIENPTETMDTSTQTEELQANTSVGESTVDAAPVEEKTEEKVEETEVSEEKETNVSVFETLDDTQENDESSVPVLEDSSTTPALTLPEMEKGEEGSIELKIDEVLKGINELKELILSKQDLEAVSSDKEMVEAAHEPTFDLPTLDSSTMPETSGDTLAQTEVVTTTDQMAQPAQGPIDTPVDDNMIMGGKFM